MGLFKSIKNWMSSDQNKEIEKKEIHMPKEITEPIMNIQVKSKNIRLISKIKEKFGNKSLKILFIDDEEERLYFLSKIIVSALKKKNIGISQQDNFGKETEAIAALQKEKYDIVFTDMNLSRTGGSKNGGVTIANLARKLFGDQVILVGVTGTPEKLRKFTDFALDATDLCVDGKIEFD